MRTMRRALQTTLSGHLQSVKCTPIRTLHVYTHGEGFLGCLGHDDFSRREEPQSVAALASVDVCKISAGWSHSAAVSTQGHLMVWGRPYDFKGSLRLNNMQRLFPFFVSTVNAFSSPSEVLPAPLVVPLHAGAPPSNTAPRGKQWKTPVVNTKSTVADPGGSDPTLPGAIEHHGPPRSPPKAVDVVCSAALTVVLTDDGRVFCMGQNRWGQCGQGPQGPLHVYEPTPVKGRSLAQDVAVSISAGLQHALVLCKSGAVYGWGKGERGQLGVGIGIEQSAVRVNLPGKAVALGSGLNHGVAVLEDGSAYIWGKMQHSEVKTRGAVPVFHDQFEPRRIDGLEGVKLVEVSCASFHTLLRADDGRLFMCGIESDTRHMRHDPVEVDVPIASSSPLMDGFNDTIVRGVQGAHPATLHALSLTSEGAVVEPLELHGVGHDVISGVSVGWQHTMVLRN